MYTICMQIYLNMKSDSYHEKVLVRRFHLLHYRTAAVAAANVKLKSIIKMLNMKMQFREREKKSHVKIRYFIHLSKLPQLHIAYR